MMIMISGGSADTEAKAETVRPWVFSPPLTVTIVTPAGKWRNALRNSSDEITQISFRESCCRSYASAGNRPTSSWSFRRGPGPAAALGLHECFQEVRCLPEPGEG